MKDRLLTWIDVTLSVIILALVVAAMDWLFSDHTSFPEVVAIAALYEATRARRIAQKERA